MRPSLSQWIAVVIFSLTGGLYLYMRYEPPPIIVGAPIKEGISITKEGAPGSVISGSERVIEEQKSVRSLTHSQQVAISYRDGTNLRALTQEALVSKDPASLYYANLYITRCIASGAIGSIGGAGTVDSSPAIREAARKFAAFCGPLLGKAAELDKNEHYSVSRSASYLNSERTRLKGGDALAKSASEKDAEWFVEAFANIETAEKLKILESELSSLKKLGPGVGLAMIDAAVAVEVCERWGCDKQYKMAALCSIDGQRACAASELEAQFVGILALDGSKRDAVHQQFKRTRNKLGQWISTM